MAGAAFRDGGDEQRRHNLWAELALCCLVLWLPHVWAGVRPMLSGYHSPGWPGRAFLTIRAIAEFALVAFLLMRRGQPLARFGFSKLSLRVLLAAVVVLAVVIVIGQGIWTWQIAAYLRRYGLGALPFAFSHPHASLATVAIQLPIGCFAEEVVFRAYFTTRLLELWGSKPAAVLVSSLMFASGHLWQGVAGVLSAGLIGAAFAVVYLRTRSIWPSTIAHAADDIMVFTGAMVPPVSWIVRHLFGAS